MTEVNFNYIDSSFLECDAVYIGIYRHFGGSCWIHHQDRPPWRTRSSAAWLFVNGQGII
jgi:hypothetical protein